MKGCRCHSIGTGVWEVTMSVHMFTMIMIEVTLANVFVVIGNMECQQLNLVSKQPLTALLIDSVQRKRAVQCD